MYYGEYRHMQTRRKSDPCLQDNTVANAQQYGAGGWLNCSACLGEFAEALGLRGPELVHPALEVLEVALDGIPLLHQEAVPLRVLLDVLRDLPAADSDRVKYRAILSSGSRRCRTVWLDHADYEVYRSTVEHCRFE